MSRSFILVRLIPEKSALWTSYFGVQVASTLVTTPFVALRILPADLGLYSFEPPTNMLFLISPEKPVGFDREYYFALTPASDDEKRTLTIDPPLQSLDGRPLYLHTCPCFRANAFLPADAEAAGTGRLSRLLDEANFCFFRDEVLHDREERRQRLQSYQKGRRVSGLDREIIGDSWQSFSDSPPAEYFQDPNFAGIYELIECANFFGVESPSLHRELLLYRQLTKEYSWQGVSMSISWLEDTRELMTGSDIHVVNLALVDEQDKSSGDTPHLSPDFLSTANTLRSMRIPLDGAPPPPQVQKTIEELMWDWDEDPEPEFPWAPKQTLPIPLGDIKFIAFELFGTILDREGAIRDALRMLIQPSAQTPSVNELLQLYIEYEALRCVGHPDTPFIDISRGTLEDVANRLDVPVGEDALKTACDCITMPDLYADVILAVQALHAHGYRLLCIQPGDAAAFHRSQHLLPGELELLDPTMSTALHVPTPSLYPTLFAHCDAVLPSVTRHQILLVTTSRYRVVEPAHDAGMASAIIRRPGNLESNVDFGETEVAAVINVDSLGSLCDALSGLLGQTIEPLCEA
ncbi:hypothetical protein A0H81_00671 [Grifola frondosa]|uniref:Uncharacterized protein n=1 Tax=Grifola frondosa TaxID=5627 RepID=A0A1C7MRX0_GRIFR|nr:hypothetical protein A0H81_00671 [Grifola frondosa]